MAENDSINNAAATKIGKFAYKCNFDYEPSRSFGDQRIFLVDPNDERLAAYCDPKMLYAHLEQSADSPTYVAIGGNTPDSSLNKIADRYRLPIEDLLEFRKMMLEDCHNGTEGAKH